MAKVKEIYTLEQFCLDYESGEPRPADIAKIPSDVLLQLACAVLLSFARGERATFPANDLRMLIPSS